MSKRSVWSPEAQTRDSRLVFVLSKGDGREGVTSFVEKREAEFKAQPSSDLPAVFDWDSEPPFGV